MPKTEIQKQIDNVTKVFNVMEFIEWMDKQGIRLCSKTYDSEFPDEPFWMPILKNKSDIVADFIGVDLDKLDEEKRIILKDI